MGRTACTEPQCLYKGALYLFYLLLLLGYKPVQHVTVLNIVDNCNTVVLYYIILYYIIILWVYRRICGPSLTETSLCGAYLCCPGRNGLKFVVPFSAPKPAANEELEVCTVQGEVK